MNSAPQSNQQPCQAWREELSLLASGLLPEPEQDRVARHLAACPECREYCAEMKRLTASLAGGVGEFAALQPSPEARARWTAAVRAAGRSEPVRPMAFAGQCREWYLDVIWPYRRIWTGLATVWVLIFAGHLSLLEASHGSVPQMSSHRQQLMIMALKDREVILAELLASPSLSPEADRRKVFVPKPKSEYSNILMT